MAYEQLTPAIFKTAKPQFADVDDATIQAYIDMAGQLVDTTWTPKGYSSAWIALTCHLMTLDGLGNDAASKGFKAGAAFYSTVRSGALTLSRFRTQAGADRPFQNWLEQTPCGKYYALMLKLNRGGPRVITTGVAPVTSPYAKDYALYGWPGVFWS